jgi:hypothetical protein
MSRPFGMATDVPATRVAAIRAAFDATMKDPAFVEDAKIKMSDPLDVRDWSFMEKFIQDAYALPKEMLERAARIMGFVKTEKQ